MTNARASLDNTPLSFSLHENNMGDKANMIVSSMKFDFEKVLGLSIDQLREQLAQRPISLRSRIHDLVHNFRREEAPLGANLMNSAEYNLKLDGLLKVSIPNNISRCISLLSNPNVYSDLRKGWSPKTRLPELDGAELKFLSKEIAAALIWSVSEPRASMLSA